MSFVLSAFAILLSVAIYPIILPVPIELQPFFNGIEVDIFAWVRMLLLGFMALMAIPKKTTPWLAVYAILLAVSFLFSSSKICLFGSPQHHEGLIALVGYIGVYSIAIHTGLTTGLQRALRTVVWIAFAFCSIQFFYGNLMHFPPIASVFPKFEYQLVEKQISGTFGSPNHLGLFCSLFLPFCFLRKWKAESLLLVLMLFGCSNRAAFLSIAAVFLFLNKRVAAIVFVLVIIFITCTKTQRDIHIPPTGHDLAGRIHLWRHEIPLIKKDILTGDGPGTYPVLIPQDEFLGLGVIEDRPHNTYLNIWQTSGLMSLVILGWIVLENIRNSRDKALQLGTIAYLINSIFTDSVLGVTPYFLIFLGVMAHEHNEEKRNRRGACKMQPGNHQPIDAAYLPMGTAI